MGNNLQPERRKEIHRVILSNYKDLTRSQIGRLLGTTPNVVNHHGKALGIQFKVVRPSGKRLEVIEGKFFNESHRENWLV